MRSNGSFRWCRLWMQYATIAFIFSSSDAWGQGREFIQRGRFFENYPFGSLAWVDASTPGAAKGALRVTSLPAQQCHSVPRRSVYWFLINHRNAVVDKKVGFFALRVVGKSREGAGTKTIRVYRNENWISEDGGTLSSGPPDTSARPPTIKEFIDLHDDGANAAESSSSRLKKLHGGLGIWHARPTADSPSSWEFRNIFASTARLEEDARPLMLNGRLLKFSTSSGWDTAAPILFYFNAGIYDTLWISVSAPNFDLRDSETEVRLGYPCN
jgi:hypothetical protein